MLNISHWFHCLAGPEIKTTTNRQNAWMDFSLNFFFFDTSLFFPFSAQNSVKLPLDLSSGKLSQKR